LLVASQSFSLLFGGIAEIYIVLMGTKGLLLYKLRHKNFLINFTAKAYVSVPFVRLGIIRRCCSKRNYSNISTENSDKFFESSLPFAFKMMGFIKA